MRDFWPGTSTVSSWTGHIWSLSFLLLTLSSLDIRSLSFLYRYVYLCAILSLRDEMLLHGMSLAFVGVSHKLKLISLGSHLYSFTVCISMLSLDIWYLGVVNTNPGFIAIVASVLHWEAKVRRFFYVKTLHSLTVTSTALDQVIFRRTKLITCMTPAGHAYAAG